MHLLYKYRKFNISIFSYTAHFMYFKLQQQFRLYISSNSSQKSFYTCWQVYNACNMLNFKHIQTLRPIHLYW